MSWFNILFQDQFLLMITRIFIALCLSGLIGIEREIKKHSAGFRTHLLVGVSSCLMMLLSLYGFEDYINKYENIRFDPARIPSYVISGIGFLGAGTILVNGSAIRGLTTAASIWAVAGLGLVVGVGMYGEAIVTTFIILLSLIFLNNIEMRFSKRENKAKFNITVHSDIDLMNINKTITDFKADIIGFSIESKSDDIKIISLELKHIHYSEKMYLIEKLSRTNHIIKISEIN